MFACGIPQRKWKQFQWLLLYQIPNLRNWHQKNRSRRRCRRWKLTAFELSSPIVKLLTDDVAVVAYKVREELMVDGKPLTLDASDTSTWVRRNGRWVCAVHTEAVAGDPFGRDHRR